MMKRLYSENHTKRTLSDVHFHSPTHFFFNTEQSPPHAMIYNPIKLSPITITDATRYSCPANMSSVSPRNNPSKPVVVRRVPTFSFKPSSSSGLGHEEDDHHQVMSLHDKPGCKLEDSLNNVRLQAGSSVLVGKGHGTSDGNYEVETLQKVDTGRERLKRHREEVAGRVLIPDKWGKEELLKDWMDYSSFDSLLAPNGLASARKALMAEGRRTGSQRLRIGSMC